MRRMYSENQLNNVIDERLGSGQVPSAKVFENIVDKDGHKRFIEGDISVNEITGVTKLYGKWSLSGSHLLVVVALNMANATAFTDNQAIAPITLPEWIVSKLVTVVGSVVIYNSATAYASDYSTQTFYTRVQKTSDTVLTILKEGALTLSKERVVRISIDFLIDNE